MLTGSGDAGNYFEIILSILLLLYFTFVTICRLSRPLNEFLLSDFNISVYIYKFIHIIAEMR